MKKLIAIAQTDRFGGSYSIVELIILNGQADTYISGDYKTEATAKAQVTRRFKNGYYNEAEIQRVSIEELRAEEARRQAPVQQQEELQHETQVVEVEQEVQTASKQEQAEALIVTMDAVQVELEQTSHWQLGASCAAELEMLKSEIEALGYEVKRVPTGWALVEQVVEVAQAVSTPAVELHEDEQGLYASIPSSTGKTHYTVRVCARWLYTVSCNCPSRVDCTHRLELDRALDTVRPTFSEQVKGVTTSREVIARMVTPDRYGKPLRGSGVTGFRAAAIAQKLAA